MLRQSQFLVKTKLWSAYLYSLNKRPFGSGAHGTAKTRMLEVFMQTVTISSAIFIKYLPRLARQRLGASMFGMFPVVAYCQLELWAWHGFALVRPACPSLLPPARPALVCTGCIGCIGFNESFVSSIALVRRLPHSRILRPYGNSTLIWKSCDQ